MGLFALIALIALDGPWYAYIIWCIILVLDVLAADDEDKPDD